MATSSSVFQLGESLHAFIYRDIILPWENGLKSASFSDLRSARLYEFEAQRGINRKAFETLDECDTFVKAEAEHLPSSYIYFNSNKKSQTYMIYRHIRNAFAHAHFEFSKGWFDLYATSGSGKFNMKARLTSQDLENYVRLLQKAVKTKSSGNESMVA